MSRTALLRLARLLLVFGLVSIGCSLTGRSAAPTAVPIPPTMPVPSPKVPDPTQTSAPAPIPTHERSTAAPFQPTAGPGDIEVDYVYTSNLITILYPLYGSKLDDFAIVTLKNPRTTTARVLVESEITGYTNRAADTVTVDPGDTLEVRQNPLLIADKIDQLNSMKPAQFYLRVAELGGSEQMLLLETTGDTTVYARRDFPWSIPGFTQTEVFELLASMVTPNDPNVEELLRKAADYTDSGIIWGGYGDNVNDEGGGVWDRLEAIWEAENDDYDLTYVSTWISYAPGSVQRIRLPAEVLDQRSGNCIELALLYASAAEAMDLEAAIVLIPGHAFMGVRMDQVNADYYFIETTMIGRSSFENAVTRGKEEFEEAISHMGGDEEWYGWVTIWDAREKGILPLPWR